MNQPQEGIPKFAPLLDLIDFTPFSPVKVNALQNKIESGLWHDETAENRSFFAGQVIANSAGIINRALSRDDCEITMPPLRYNLPLILQALPDNLRTVITESGHERLERVLDPYQVGEPGILSNEQYWLDITSGLANGVINSDNNPVLLTKMEDLASGLMRYVNLLVAENDGLVMDSYTKQRLSSIAAAYNKLFSTDSINSNFGAADTAAGEVADLAAGEINHSAAGGMNRIIAAGKRALAGALGHTDLAD